MKIVFLTEGTFEGKYPRNHPNARVDVAWQVALDAYHLPMYTNWANPIDHYEFDLAIWIIPKKNIDYVMKQEDYITSLRKMSKKVAIMQEGPSWFFQDYPLDQQIWFFNQLCSVDIIYAHNYNDKKYFEGLTNHKDIRLMQSVMIEDSIDQEKIVFDNGRKNVIIGGNQCRWYGGFDSFIVAQEFGCDIYAPAMGRKIAGEEQIVNILPYVQWNEWVTQLSQFKYAIHLMPTQAAGTFALNCAYLGIPNIGYHGLDTQEVLFPNLTVEMGDLLGAKRLVKKLMEEEDFYKEQSRIARINYKNVYTEESFKISFYDKFN
jgi:hypothetical protein